MKNKLNKTQNNQRAFPLKSELEKDEPNSQRKISGQLDIALGLLNTNVKNLEQKKFITVESYPIKRYAYLLTPNGFAENNRLAYRYLSNFNKFNHVTHDRVASPCSAVCALNGLVEVFFRCKKENPIWLPRGLKILNKDFSDSQWSHMSKV